LIALSLSIIRRRYAYPLVCIVATAGLALPRPAHAATPAQIPRQGSPAGQKNDSNYRIPAGPLAQALALFAEMADVSLSYDPALVQGKSSPGLSGVYTVAAGFARLLDGSGLAAVFPVSGGYVLRPLPPSIATGAAAVASTAPVATLAVVTVAGATPDDGYAPAADAIATGTATPLHQIAQSVQVISADIIKDQQSQSLFDILQNIGGIDNNPGLNGYGMDSYDVRGFGAPLYVDGVAYAYLFNLPAMAIERVEVLKGAESTLAGDMEPSGMIAISTKQPQRKPVHEASLQVGSFGDVATAIDVGGAYPTANAADQRLLYRVVLSDENANRNFLGYRGSRQLYFAPSLAWDDGTTRLVAGLQYTDGRAPQWPYTVPINDRPAAVTQAVDNEDEHADYNWSRLYYQYSHKLNADWSIRSNASLSTQSATQYAYFSNPANSLGDAYFLSSKQAFRQQNFDTDLSLAGNFVAGKVKHNVVFGLAFSSLNAVRHSVEGASYVVNNIFQSALPFPSPGADGQSSDADGRSRNVRIYAQDFMSFGKRWHVTTAIGLNRSRENGDIEKVWTPKFGVSYDLSDLVSVYGNYSRSVAVQPVLLQDGTFAPPVLGKVIETGIKLSWPDKPLDLSFAVFRASERNPAQAISFSDVYIVTPGGSSRGVEFSLQGRITAGWKTIASYSYTDFHAPPGEYDQTPRHTASLWNTYTFQRPALRNWGVGMGIYSRSAYTGDGMGVIDFVVPGQTRTDLSLFYRGGRFSTTLGVKNVFDRTLYAGRATAEQIFMEPRRTILLTTDFKF
jgi:iron complex outermembrane receptor protein